MYKIFSFLFLFIVIYSCEIIRKKNKTEKNNKCEYEIFLDELDIEKLVKENLCYSIKFARYSGIKERRIQKKMVKELFKRYEYCYGINKDDFRKYYFDSICSIEGYCLKKVELTEISGSIGYSVTYRRCE